MNWLFLTASYHEHARQMAYGLHESGRLGGWLSSWLRAGGISKDGGWLRQKLNRRNVDWLAQRQLYAYPLWEWMRLLAGRWRGLRKWEDFLWEKLEWKLDHEGSRLCGRFDGVIGFEHGCLSSLKTAREQNKPGVVVFASLHHRTVEKILLPEIEQHPEWQLLEAEYLRSKSVLRDARRDEEMQVADQILMHSTRTQRSLLEAGVPSEKMKMIPLGLPKVEEYHREDCSGTTPLRMLYVGGVTLQKGFHHLQKAIKKMKGKHFTLDVYGKIMVHPEVLISDSRVRFHGSVGWNKLKEAYRQADVLIFPTLADGAGLVVGEALSFGVPVVCSENAGAVDWIVDGQNGFRIKAGSHESILWAIDECLSHRKDLSAMRNIARHTCEQWHWNHFRREWVKWLESIEKKEGV